MAAPRREGRLGQVWMRIWGRMASASALHIVLGQRGVAGLVAATRGVPPCVGRHSSLGGRWVTFYFTGEDCAQGLRALRDRART